MEICWSRTEVTMTLLVHGSTMFVDISSCKLIYFEEVFT